jgi:ABC-type branched-subunit amino acid transport system ATPase component
MALLEVQDLCRSFGGVVAVDRVSFKVVPGQIKAIIGANGAGKTTLFNLISGLLKPETGIILFKDRPIGGCKPYQIARRGLSRTFQNPSLFLQMSVLENVMVGQHHRTHWGFLACSLRWPGQPAEERAIRRTALAELDALGLAHLAQTPADALAFGQRRMVELARALATRPDLLLLDEPASGLNTKDKADLGGFLRRVRERGVTLLLVEHDMTMVMSLADDILVLHNGRPLAEGPPAAIQSDPNVLRVYLGGELHDVAPSQ